MAMLEEENLTILSPLVPSPEDLIVSEAFCKHSCLVPWYIRAEMALVAIRLQAGVKKKKSLPRTSHLRNTLALHLPQYHHRQPTGAAFLGNLQGQPFSSHSIIHLTQACQRVM